MIVATFNVNGIKARLPALLDWLTERRPDVCVLQEIKSVDAEFPAQPIEDLGYVVHTHGQKGFNGVAILSRVGVEDVSRGLPGDPADEQARWIEATVAGRLRVCGLYLPNGNPAPGPKYDYKLAWMARLHDRARALLAFEEPVVMLGDYNVIPEPRDVHDPAAWAADALYLPASRQAWRRLTHLGYTDALRALSDAQAYTFWDYQAGAWGRNRGIRIDHALLSPQAADLLRGAAVDRDVRGREKASDHAPVWIDLAL